jgi:hypothetical protein
MWDFLGESDSCGVAESVIFTDILILRNAKEDESESNKNGEDVVDDGD